METNNVMVMDMFKGRIICNCHPTLLVFGTDHFDLLSENSAHCPEAADFIMVTFSPRVDLRHLIVGIQT